MSYPYAPLFTPLTLGDLGEHLRAVGVQAFQKLRGGALEGFGGFQRLLAVQRMDGVHQGVRMEGPGIDQAKAALGRRTRSSRRSTR